MSIEIMLTEREVEKILFNYVKSIGYIPTFAIRKSSGYNISVSMPRK